MKCAIQRQLSVAIENQPGRLAAVSRLMADRGINIKDLSVVDNVEQGMIRLIPSDAALCKSLLVSQGLNVVEADVLELILKDTPGKLALVSQALADAQVNIDYAYGSEDAAQDRMRLIIKVSNITKAVQALHGLLEDRTMPGVLEGRVGIVPPGALGVALFAHLTQGCRRLDGDVVFMERSGSKSGPGLREEGCIRVALEDGEIRIPAGRFFKSGFRTCLEQDGLPEVILVATNPDQILDLISDVVEVLEVLLGQGGGADQPLVFPAIILCANGIYFQRARLFFIEKIEEATLLGRLPDLWPHRMPAIVGRLLRGVTIQTGIRESTGEGTLYRPGPSGITRLAGSDPAVRDRCCRLLQAKGGWYEAGRGSATRLEFDKALVNLTANLLGQLYAFDETGRFQLLRVHDIMTPDHEAEIRDLARRVFKVGQAVKAYEPNEDFEAVYQDMKDNLHDHDTHVPSSLQWVDLKLRQGRLEPVLTPTETWLLEPLIRYARSAGLDEAAAYFQTLRERLMARLVLAAQAARC